jgi:hypothetical protein
MKRCGKDRRSEEVETLHENDQEFVQKRTQGFCWGAQNRQREHISLREHSIRPRNPRVPGAGVIPENKSSRGREEITSAVIKAMNSNGVVISC